MKHDRIMPRPPILGRKCLKIYATTTICYKAFRGGNKRQNLNGLPFSSRLRELADGVAEHCAEARRVLNVSLVSEYLAEDSRHWSGYQCSVAAGLV